jgi:hypothetical protein
MSATCGYRHPRVIDPDTQSAATIAASAIPIGLSANSKTGSNTAGGFYASGNRSADLGWRIQADRHGPEDRNYIAAAVHCM